MEFVGVLLILYVFCELCGCIIDFTFIGVLQISNR